ncbi:hypothetical protein JAAARDRAFT_236610 [Jaapia argillacea MUCL 33604]|uniref:Uncharacterized protein n=1 Tax=Jaapia argillacea MUCL 33604 TaxID=933084 RepID=A0A067QEY2_9AGAM|nr:hypothetical protein JAAARDRAFT_236610 [Jaapia argillacea MUCL 33604]
MNAASKGHLPIVLYLLTKQNANPLVRNNWGETAYDAAAAVFEVWICEVLQKAEAERWRGTTVPYDPLAVHTTVPLILYENQRLDVRFKTLAVSGGRPKFSASGLGKRGRRGAFELRLPKVEDGGREIVTAWRSDVHLPLRVEPFRLPAPDSRDRASSQGVERSHFWLSDWTLDVTPPGVDADDGWQYAHKFSDPDDQWTAEQPLPLQRLLSGTGALTAGLGSPSASSSASNGQPRSRTSSTSSSQTWVRRRRWVRVMRRRLDIPPLPYLEPDGSMYHMAPDGTLIPAEIVGDDGDSGFGEEGRELGAMPSSVLSAAGDYVGRARYLAGELQDEGEDGGVGGSGAGTALEVRRAIAKLERATTELRQGVMGDTNLERKVQAEILLDAYSQELQRRRLAAGAQGLLISGDGDDHIDDDDDDDDDEFHYPGASSPAARPSSLRSASASASDYFSRSRVPTDLTPHLSQAPEFRVPTHESPQKVLTPRWTPPTPHQVHAQWERDSAVPDCRDCRRRFSLLVRRVSLLRHPSFANCSSTSPYSIFSITVADAAVYSATAALLTELSWTRQT